MEILYCVIWSKYRKFDKPKISYLLEKTLVPSFICIKCENEDKKMFKKKNQLRYQNSWFNSKYIITFKIWPKKTYVKNLDWKI